MQTKFDHIPLLTKVNVGSLNSQNNIHFFFLASELVCWMYSDFYPKKMPYFSPKFYNFEL